MTMDELYDSITDAIDAPYETKVKAIIIFNAIEKYLISALPGYSEGDGRFKFDFDEYVDILYNELEDRHLKK